MMEDLVPITLKVNGVEHRVAVEPRRLLSDAIRDDVGLTGTHVGCEHGVCGACTVLLDGRSVRSCLMFAVQAEGSEIMTVEALAKDGELHPLQVAFWENHGLQCGFCTPGFLMTAYELLQANPSPTEEQIRERIAGNLCRCTGYQNIVTSIRDAAGRGAVPAPALGATEMPSDVEEDAAQTGHGLGFGV
jgi:aerobic carbon-monoxide dehydrogenase small subunit